MEDNFFEDFLENLVNKMRSRNSLKRRAALTRIKYRRWQEEKAILSMEEEIKKEKKEIKDTLKKEFPSWAKILLIFLFINFTVIEIFTGWVTVSSFALAYAIGTMPDFTPLVTLIGAVIGQTLSYGFYSFKSKAENTEGGIVYEAAMFNLRNGIMDDNNGDTPVG